MSELKPCGCGHNINETYRIQSLWHGIGGQNVGIAYCSYCNEVAAFSGRYLDDKEFRKDAEIAWNTRTTPTKEEVIEVVHGLMIPTGNHEYHDEILRKVIAAIEGMK